MLLQGLGCAAGVQGIVAKAINVFGLVRTERGQGFRVRGVAFVQQLPQGPGYGYQRVKGKQVGYEVIVFDELTLLITHVFGNHALATEADPLHESVKVA